MRRDINDGYTWSGVLTLPNGDEFRFRYRPITKAEARHAREGQVIHMGPDGGLGALREYGSQWLSTHIVESNYKFNEKDFIRELWDEHPILFRKLVRILIGKDGPQPEGTDWEVWSSANLHAGTKLFLSHKKLSTRDCSDCQKHWYDEEAGEPIRHNGLKILRPAGTPTLCQTEDGCPKGTPDKQNSWHEINRRAFQHWTACQAVNQFPTDDPIVRRNAVIIAAAYKEVEHDRRKRQRSNQRSLGGVNR